MERNRYFSTFLSEGSRYLVVHCSRSKSLAAAYTSSHITRIHADTPYRIQGFSTDNAREYYTSELRVIYHRQHINTTPIIPHQPQENALSERINRTLWNKARSNVLASGLPLSLWHYDIMAAVDVFNHTPHNATGQLPATFWYGKVLDVASLLPFGTQGFALNPATKTKLDPRAKSAYYNGRSDNRHYYIYNIHTNSVSRCRSDDFKQFSASSDPVRALSAWTKVLKTSSPYSKTSSKFPYE